MTDNLRLAERRRTYVSQRLHHTAGAGTPRSCRGLAIRTNPKRKCSNSCLIGTVVPSHQRFGKALRLSIAAAACAEVIHPTARPSPSYTSVCKCLSGPVIQEALM